MRIAYRTDKSIIDVNYSNQFYSLKTQFIIRAEGAV